MKSFDVHCPACSHYLCRVEPEVLEMTVCCSCCGNRMTVRKLSSRHYVIGWEGDPGAMRLLPDRRDIRSLSRLGMTAMRAAGESVPTQGKA